MLSGFCVLCRSRTLLLVISAYHQASFKTFCQVKWSRTACLPFVFPMPRRSFSQSNKGMLHSCVPGDTLDVLDLDAVSSCMLKWKEQGSRVS